VEDSKPILELLAEYKAEIVEEEITDLPEYSDVSKTVQSVESFSLSLFHSLSLLTSEPLTPFT